ncbi:MAG: Nramp family divalent metal transporter, partial [Cyclobacteriaceae bacterium]|nr:Nramp family divalent metal transporter [Cyclobacteriaceae bacterium]
MDNDPYVRSGALIKDPPVSFLGRLKFIGPGMILSASIVGSGELIATTTLGAQAGFVTFWVIIVSCLVKVAVQVEFAKHTILSGETPMEVINELPGPRRKGVSWSVWTLLFFIAIKMIQVGGVLGGVAILMSMVFSVMSNSVWTFVIAIIVSLLVFKGYYRFIEKASLWMMAFFTLFTFASLYFLNFTPYQLSLSDILSGLTFQLPTEAVAVAIGAFGITGVGGDEIIFYNYWCLEKGYAAYTGTREDGKAWEQRARGWIRTMK